MCPISESDILNGYIALYEQQHQQFNKRRDFEWMVNIAI
jgi:hypothetical protein